jgi:ribulose-phosphate 3-epimerase
VLQNFSSCAAAVRGRRSAVLIVISTMNVKIAPSLLSADFSRLADELKTVEAADLLHLDVMDGHFVPNITIGPLIVKACRAHSRLPFDCHLMISNPQQYIPAFLDAGANMISVHFEAEAHLQRAFQLIRDGGARAGVAINPATPAEALTTALDFCDYVLVMSVNPGFGGQSFIPDSIEKIAAIRTMIGGRAVTIAVDGGVSAENAGALARAGADVLFAGSAIFSGGAANYAKRIRALRTAATAIAA